MIYSPSTIDIPSYLLSDVELLSIASRLQEMQAEAVGDGEPECERAVTCLEQIQAELNKRSAAVTIHGETTH